MGYNQMTIEKLQEIFRRWYHSHTIKSISDQEHIDRKTIRKYINQFKLAGYHPEKNYPDKEKLITFLKSILPQNKKESPLENQLAVHLDEITNLLNDPKEPVKVITAWKIIQSRYQLSCSYELFKKVVRKNNIKKNRIKTIIRIERPPGQEIQVDYGKMGTIHDPVSEKNKAVWAFCGIMSHSRLPYIEFCFKQDQTSFVKSHIKMFNFYGGSPEYITLDNLKAGVIKPDIYDPKLNKAYCEMAEYHEVFINPCRVMSPEEKGKIERMVPSARELFRMLKHIHPTYNIHQLNKEAKKWCIDEYGQKEHGTTGIPPLTAFEKEKQTLKPLPADPFTIPVWKKVKVHPDQFFSFENKRYSVPIIYRSSYLWVKREEQMLYIYSDYNLIRTYVLTENKVNYYKTDFPEILGEMLNGGYPKYLLDQALLLGDPAFKLIESILKPNAYLNTRRAQGVLEILKKNKEMEHFDEICAEALKRRINIPKKLKILFNDEKDQLYFDFEKKSSKQGKKMARPADYYIN